MNCDFVFFFSSRRRHTRCSRDWSSDVCSSDLRKGCSVHVQEMLRALQGHGASVDLFAARVDEAPPSGLESLQIHHLTPVGDGDPASHAAAIAALNDQLAALLDRAGPYDVVYERYSLWSFAGME